MVGFSVNIRYWWLVDRDVIGADTVVALAILIHVYQGVIFLSVTSDNGWPVAVAVLLRICGSIPALAAVLLFAVSALAVVGQWGTGVNMRLRWCLLLPQLTLFMITSVAAIFATVFQTYDNGVHASWAFISVDQISRIVWPIAYASAIWARIRHG